MSPGTGGNTAIGRCILLALLLTAFAIAADPPIPPVTVCEVLADLPAHEGKETAVLGRYSFRHEGRWMSEQSCDPAVTVSTVLWLTEDSTEVRSPPSTSNSMPPC